MMATLHNMLESPKRVFVIAEIGKNFIQTREEQTIEEYLGNAKRLVKAAKEAGADAVKFQTHNAEDEQLDVNITSPHFSGSDRYAWVTRNTEATPAAFWKELKAYCDELGIIFFATPMSRGAAEMLASVDVPFWKVGSGDILDFVLLDYLAETKKPIIISSGMSTQEELDKAVAFLKKRNADLFLMHCVSKYPCPENELYLDTIPHLAERYGLLVGFSDHSLGHAAALASVGKGVRIIEKHFSLDRDAWGADHNVSMLPDEFAAMVKAIRSASTPETRDFGSGVKTLDEAESAFRPIFRKSLMAAHGIPKGSIITKKMLYAMRPQQYAVGLPSEEYENVLGKRAARDLKKYDPITHNVIQT